MRPKSVIEIPDVIIERIGRIASYLAEQLECDCESECSDACPEDCDGCAGECLWSAALSALSFTNALGKPDAAGVSRPREPYDRASTTEAGMPWQCHVEAAEEAKNVAEHTTQLHDELFAGMQPGDIGTFEIDPQL